MKLLRVLGWVFLWFVTAAQAKQPALIFSCSEDNDLYAVVRHSGYSAKRFATPAVAIENAAPDSVVLLLADKYPLEQTAIDASALDVATTKHLRLFIEYPES